MLSINTLMWQSQNVLHKKPQIVPGTLLLLASSMVVYRHMTHAVEEHKSDVIKTFLAMVVVQMLPLVALEMKIMSCADPVGLFCKFATPVTLIHAFFLGMRLVIYDMRVSNGTLCNAVFFVGSLMAIFKGYRQGFKSIIECSTVWGLITLALGAALCTTSVDAYLKPEYVGSMPWEDYFQESFETANSYIELIAFVPAVWTVYRESQTTGRFQIESGDTKRISTTFFVFLVCFYVIEDIMGAYQAFAFSRMASLAHVAHFCLLVDFAFYVLAHIYNPEKLVGELRRWLPVDCYHEV
jgi:hypothetical protein